MLEVEEVTNVRVVRTVREAKSTAVITVVRAVDWSSITTMIVYTDMGSTVRDCESTAVTIVVTREGSVASSEAVGCSCSGVGVTVNVATIGREAEFDAVTVVTTAERSRDGQSCGKCLGLQVYCVYHRFNGIGVLSLNGRLDASVIVTTTVR
jgi:hypothetical protein